MINRQCLNCLHRVDSDSSDITCLAFPDGIPEEIITGQVDHSKPYPGDHGFRYQPSDVFILIDPNVGPYNSGSEIQAWLAELHNFPQTKEVKQAIKEAEGWLEMSNNTKRK